MSFGDWELFKMVILNLRESELNAEEREFITRNVRFDVGLALDVPSGGSLNLDDNVTPLSSLPSDASSRRLTNVESPTLTEIT